MIYAKAIKLNEKFIICKASLSQGEIDRFIMDNDNNIVLDETPCTESILVDETEIIIFEWTDYKVIALNGFEFSETDFAGKGSFGKSDFGYIKIKNRFGYIFFCNVKFRIKSKKISDDECNNMVQIVNHYVSSLSYDFNQATYSSIQRDFKTKTDIDYHVYLMIINALQTSDYAVNIYNNFSIIQRNPHRFLDINREERYIGELSDITEDIQSELMSGGADYIESKVENSLSRRFSVNGKMYVPKSVIVEEVNDSYDNPENRFIKFFFEYCLDVIERFQQHFLEMSDFLNKPQIEKNSKHIGKIKTILSNTFLRNVGEMQIFPVSSTVLTRQEGYRQIYGLFAGIQALPQGSSIEDNIKEVIENKAIDVLYENYCFFIIADILSSIYGENLINMKLEVIKNDYSKTLEKKSYHNCFTFDSSDSLPSIILHYNKNYCFGESYSKPYDPDISLEIYDDDGHIAWIYCFDAKFKNSVFGNFEDDELIKMYKYDDISKMHAYKDAIKKAIGAYVLYPGTENKFYAEDVETPEVLQGVGAFCLRPGNDSDLQYIRGVLITIIDAYK